jgi:hypothetical protein
MLKSDPFLLSAAEIATTEAMRANGTIPQDWRYIDIPWQHAAIFDKIIEIGGADLRVLDCGQCDEKKRGQIVLGPEASKRINERAFEIRVLFKTAAYKTKVAALASEKAA